MNGTRKRSRWLAVGVLVLLVGAVLIIASPLFRQAPVNPPASPDAAELSRQVHALCAACHAYPPPDSFPRYAWRHEVEQGYEFAKEFRPDLPRPPIEQV